MISKGFSLLPEGVLGFVGVREGACHLGTVDEEEEGVGLLGISVMTVSGVLDLDASTVS